MYCQHFGFSKPPFRITPDPELFFAGGNRGAVLDALLYAVGRGEGIVKVVGEVGSGKTMLCRMLERELPAHCEIIYLANPSLGPEEILPAIASELRIAVPPGTTRIELMHRLHDHLLARHADARRVVMFVEEAQGMPLATLEEIRLLSNLETAEDKLLQIVLFGQPELDAKLARHEIRQLNERITYRFTLAPLGRAEIRDYLLARVRATGYRGPELFTPGAIRALARHSRGLLRRINVLADKALLAAYSGAAPRVRGRHVDLAARDSEFLPRRAWPVWGFAVGGLAGAATLAIGAWFALPLPSAPALAPAASRGAPAVLPLTRYTDFAALSPALAEVDPATSRFSPAVADPQHLMDAFARLERLTDAPAEVLMYGSGAPAYAR